MSDGDDGYDARVAEHSMLHESHATAGGLWDRSRDVAVKLVERQQEHQLTLVAAGVAFYAFIALIPALVVAATIYGVFADPDQIRQQVESAASALPRQTRTFLTSQLQATTTVTGAGVGVIAIVGLLATFWSASAGVSALLRALAVANGSDPRKFAKQRGLALVLTLGIMVFVLVAVWLITTVPPMLASATGMGDALRLVLEVLRWPLVAALAIVVFAALYRLSAGYEPRGLVTTGPIVATVLWLAGSALFSVYTANFSSYSETYGTLSIVIVVMLWLYLGAIAVLVGAEVDAIIAERNEHRDG